MDNHCWNAVQEAEMLLRQGEWGQARTVAEQALMAAQTMQDPMLMGQASLLAGRACRHMTVSEEALQFCALAQNAFQQAGDRYGAARTQMELGALEQAAGRYAEAEARYRPEWTDLLSGEQLCEVLRHQAALCTAVGRFEQAAQLLQNSQNAASGSLSEQARTCLEEGLLQREMGHRQAAEATLNSALSLAKQAGCKDVLARAELRLGALCSSRGDFAEAIRHFDAAWPLLAETGDACGQALEWYEYGLVYLYRADFLEAHRHLEEARERAIATGEKALQADTDRALAYALLQGAGDEAGCRLLLTEAGEIYTNLLAEARQNRDARHMLAYLSLIAECMTEKGEIAMQEAQPYLAEAVHLLEKMPELTSADKENAARIFFQRGYIADIAGDKAESWNCYLQSERLAEQGGDLWRTAQARACRAMHLYQAGRREEARQLMQQAHDIFAALGRTKDAGDILPFLQSA